MLIGIKYCGGCNSGYQRGMAVKRLKDAFPGHVYEVAGEAKEWDLGLVVCGCQRACVDDAIFVNCRKKMVLTSEADFREVMRYLKGNAQAGEVQPMEQKSIHIGDRASVQKLFYKDDAEKFAALTGDKNRLHLDGKVAAGSLFGRPVIHGVLVSSLMSAVMGTELPGEGTVFLEETVKYRKPVYYGDTITAEVVFLEAEDRGKFYLGHLQGECRNQKGEVVASGQFLQMLDKKWFFVEFPEEASCRSCSCDAL